MSKVYKVKNRNSGIIALTAVLVIGLFLFSIGMLLVIQSSSSIFSGQFSTQADRAQFLAEAGVQEALIRLGRNQGYTTASTTISETDGTANFSVVVSNTTTSIVIVTSTVSQGGESVQRVIKATVVFETATSGKISTITKENQ